MQSKQQYLFPHQSPKWLQTKIKLIKVLGDEQITKEHLLEVLNNLNDNMSWNSKTFSQCNYIEIRLVQLIKFIITKALEVQKLFEKGLKFSTKIESNQGNQYSVLSKKQCVCLVANMFLGLTLKQQVKDLPVFFTFSKLSRYPNEILKVILNYFSRIQEYEHTNNPIMDTSIVYWRMANRFSMAEWRDETRLCEVQFSKQSYIEDKQTDLQIDFANKSIGGFFLSNTYTQEDIIFINSPQLMPSVLFHHYMDSHQCILMIGAERYSTYTGYLDTYRFSGNFVDERPIIEIELGSNYTVKVRDSWISAIDAIPYFINSQFNQNNLLRQLNKAYVGFHINGIQPQKWISTGNWGSGAFCGNLQYKFLIQWIAASKATRNIYYSSFQNPDANDIPLVINSCKNMRICDLMEILINNQHNFEKKKNIFSIVRSICQKQTTEQIKKQNV